MKYSRQGSADVDEVLVKRVIERGMPTLTIAEREECVRRLHARGWSDPRIAAQVGITARTSIRIRQRLGLPGIPKGEQTEQNRQAR